MPPLQLAAFQVHGNMPSGATTLWPWKVAKKSMRKPTQHHQPDDKHIKSRYMNLVWYPMFQEPKSLFTYLVQTTIVLWTQTIFGFARILNVMTKEACCPDAVSYNSVPRPIFFVTARCPWCVHWGVVSTPLCGVESCRVKKKCPPTWKSNDLHTSWKIHFFDLCFRMTGCD